MRTILSIFIITAVCSLKAQSPGDTITLDLSNPSNPPFFELNEKGYWTETYSSSFPTISFGIYSFSHLSNGGGGVDVGGGMSYWDGFTYSVNGDNENYGMLGSSEGWIANQWGCMAGGNTPYLVGYWGYWIEENAGGEPSLKAWINDGQSYEAVGVYICNHPWPYYGNIHGDGFASPFGDGDFFKLHIHGLNELGEDIGNPVEYTLAEYKNGELIQSADWEWVDLSSLGTVSGFYFTMTTSDYDPIYGANTAAYFCMDKLQVRVPEETLAPTRPSGITGIPRETTIQLSWQPSTGSTEIKGYHVYLNDTFVSFVSGTEYTLTELMPYTSYHIDVEAVGEDNIPSEKGRITVRTTDETPPSVPGNLMGIPTQTSIALTWDTSSDNVAVTGYNVYLNGQREKRVTETFYSLTLLDPSTTYTIEVESLDAAGNRSEQAMIQLTTLSETTGLSTIKENEISVYPNPFSEYIIVETTNKETVYIYNISGKRVRSIQTTIGKNTIPVTDLPAGSYILKVGEVNFKIVKS